MCLISKEPFFIYCKESRIESPTSLYGCFSLGLFEMSQSLTIANALRRTLLSNISGIAITFVKIEGVFHEYESIPGIKESVLDILLNLKQIVLKHEKIYRTIGENFKKIENTNFLLKKPFHGYLQARGPGIVRARDLKLPFFIQCVDPMQYIATLSSDGLLNIKFEIGSFFTEKTKDNGNAEYKRESKKDIFVNEPKITNQENYENELDFSYFSQSNLLFPLQVGANKGGIKKSSFNQFTKKFKNLSVDAVFSPINKVNFVLELSKQSKQQIFDHRIILEVWTNGSLHPRQAVSQAIKHLIQIFIRLEKVNVLQN